MEAVVYGALTRVLPDAAQRPRQNYVAPASLAASAWRTELSVTGAGYLYALFAKGTSRALVQFRVTVDGGTPNVISGGNAGAGIGVINGDINTLGLALGTRFTSSLLVEVNNLDTVTVNVGSNTIYGLDV